MFVISTLKDDITLVHDGFVTIGRVFIGETTSDVNLIRALGVVGGRKIQLFTNPVMLTAPEQSVLAVQINVKEEDFRTKETA